ncbi:DUF6415 family natural product biosynthesis protein [Streptomyces daliensis]|uniref:Uncharacterized protein n=1 Tax=Streptomyces daliensis TaxID=299421 RepID=A0A8T4IMC5_9ACTN|nr:hypothetical protein [Streptomyces daliensis]
MTITHHPGLAQREGRVLEVERVPLAPVTTLRIYVEALHESFVQDDEIDDVLDVVLGKESALLTPEELHEVLPRLRKILRQLVNIAVQRASGEGGPELADVVARAQRLDAAPAPADFRTASGFARRLALVSVDVLEVLAVAEEDAAHRRWSV